MGIFLDSGAHSIYELKVKKANKGFGYYESDEFWEYVDNYVSFIKKNKGIIDVYVSVDVIFDPELSWKVQQTIEDVYKLTPMPVFHYKEDRKWLKKYADRYEYIGIGGMGQDVHKQSFPKYHADAAFTILCGNKRSAPANKVHGFAVTSIDWIKRYPWFSVDSATPRIQAGYGILFTPPIVKGKFDYTGPPNRYFLTGLSGMSTAYAGNKYHASALKDEDRETFERYLEECLPNYKLGESKFFLADKKYIPRADEKVYKGDAKQTKGKVIVERVIEDGLSTDSLLRTEANMIYYKKAVEAISNAKKEGRIKPFPFVGIQDGASLNQRMGEAATVKGIQQLSDTKIFFVASDPSGVKCVKNVGGNLLVSFYFMKAGSSLNKKVIQFVKGEKKNADKRKKIEKSV